MVVAMTRESLDGFQFGLNFVCHTKDGNDLVATHNFGTQSSRGAVTHAEDGGAGILDIVGQVVFDTAGFHHPRSGNDDTGAVVSIKSFRIIDGAHIMQFLEAEGVFGTFHKLLHISVKAVFVQAKNIGCGHCQGTIDKDFHIG